MNRIFSNGLSYSRKIASLIATVAVAVVCCSVFVACDNPTETLSTPTAVVLTERVLTWDSVANASGYTVKVGDEEIIVDDNSYELNIEESGRYEIKVKANGDGKSFTDSDWSESLEYALI